MIQEARVHNLPHGVVSPEGERQVTHPTAHMDAGKSLLDGPGSFDIGVGILVMLFNPCCHGENVRIEDEILRREADLLCQEGAGTLTYLHFSFICISLPLLVKRHYNHRRTVLPDEARLFKELLLPLF